MRISVRLNYDSCDVSFRKELLFRDVDFMRPRGTSVSLAMLHYQVTIQFTQQTS